MRRLIVTFIIAWLACLGGLLAAFMSITMFAHGLSSSLLTVSDAIRKFGHNFARHDYYRNPLPLPGCSQRSLRSPRCYS